MRGNQEKITLQLKPFIKALFVLFMLISTTLFPNKANAQRSGGGEIGVLGGGSYYMGDINLARHMYSPSLNIGGFYKHHLNSRYLIRLGVFFSTLKADDLDFKSGYQQLRAKDFSTSIIEGSLQVEFNFLSYIIGETRKKNYTPYIQTGLSYYLAPEAGQPIGFALPMGVGFKANLTHRIVIGAEWTFRRVFNDMFDGVTGEDLMQYDITYNQYASTANIRQMGFRMNKDWYSYAGISLSYSFSWGGFPCPAYDVY